MSHWFLQMASPKRGEAVTDGAALVDVDLLALALYGSIGARDCVGQ